MTSDFKVYSRQILDENGIGERCLFKWVHDTPPRFPAPDGNLNGRNFWHRSTYEAWKADVAAGKYRQHRRPGAVPERTGIVSVKHPDTCDIADLERMADEVLSERSRPSRARPQRHAAKAGVLEAAAQRKQESQP
jgi:hypothetical protein